MPSLVVTSGHSAEGAQYVLYRRQFVAQGWMAASTFSPAVTYYPVSSLNGTPHVLVKGARFVSQRRIPYQGETNEAYVHRSDCIQKTRAVCRVSRDVACRAQDSQTLHPNMAQLSNT